MSESVASTELRNCTLCGATVFQNTKACGFCGNIVEQTEEQLSPAIAVQTNSPVFVAAVAGILLLSGLYITVVIGRTHPMLHPFFRLGVAWLVTSFLLAITVILDANRMHEAGDSAAPAARFTPQQWFAATLVVWPLALPLYCAGRRRESSQAYLIRWIAVVAVFVTAVLATVVILKRNSDRFYPPNTYRLHKPK